MIAPFPPRRSPFRRPLHSTCSGTTAKRRALPSLVASCPDENENLLCRLAFLCAPPIRPFRATCLVTVVFSPSNPTSPETNGPSAPTDTNAPHENSRRFVAHAVTGGPLHTILLSILTDTKTIYPFQKVSPTEIKCIQNNTKRNPRNTRAFAQKKKRPEGRLEQISSGSGHGHAFTFPTKPGSIPSHRRNSGTPRERFGHVSPKTVKKRSPRR
jgi:hypothetical protein